MARWTKNHMLELGVAILALGLIATLVAFIYNWAYDAPVGTTAGSPSWLNSYHDLVSRPQGDFNLFLLIAGPILLIWGAFWVGEQLVFRRRFERLLDTPKKSEFATRRPQLEEISRRLPDGYKKRIAAKEGEFSSKRA